MPKKARECVQNASFVQGDAQVHPFDAEGFDAAISRYGMTFFTDPVAAFTKLHRALRPRGRLAFICAAEAEANEWLQATTSLHGILPLGDFGKPGALDMFSLTNRSPTPTTSGCCSPRAGSPKSMCSGSRCQESGVSTRQMPRRSCSTPALDATSSTRSGRRSRPEHARH
ncbi:class I SAM-dependent methyltransferase [Streptomyces sp. DSM 116496]|uniref:class I SAM-dependent methyltransferase n=1 Tax=Streptomyces stoeckheimensis TaxID=3344656 RepID=UPI0038B35143